MILLSAVPLLFGCGSEEPTPAQSQRIALGESGPPQAIVLEADSQSMAWQVRPDGNSLAWGQPPEPPLLTLQCLLSAQDQDQPQLSIIRHIAAPPGARAFFAVLGNGMAARLKVDAQLAENEWRWEGSYPADAAELDVFTGPRDITATLPGGGMLEIGGSDLPRQFIQWCRNGGVAEPAENPEAGDETADSSGPAAESSPT